MQQFSFLKHAGVYAVGDLLVNAAGLLLVPLYTRRLSRGEFDDLEIIDTTAQVLTICLLARGITMAVFAFANQSRTEDERRQAVGAAYLLTGGAMLAGALLLLPAVEPLGRCLNLPTGWLLWTALVAALIDGVALVGHSLNQARMDSEFYAAISFGQFVVKVGLCVLFVAGFGWGVWGVVAASLVRALLFAAILFRRECRIGLAWPQRAILREMLAFAWPFLPTGLGFFILNSADRYFLLPFAGDGEIGSYGLAYKLAGLVGLVSITPLYRVWSARMYAAAETPDAAVVFGRVTTWLLTGYLFVGLGLSLLEVEVVMVYAGPAFVGGSALPIMAVIILANGLQAASTLLEGPLYVRRQTRWKVWITMASTTVMLTLYALLIPNFGPWGAAVATLFGFAFHAAITYAVAQRVLPVRHELGRLAALLASAVAVWLVGYGLGAGLWLAPLKVGLWLLWPVLLWTTGLIRADEKAWLLGCVQRVVQRLPLRRRSLGQPRP